MRRLYGFSDRKYLWGIMMDLLKSSYELKQYIISITWMVPFWYNNYSDLLRSISNDVSKQFKEKKNIFCTLHQRIYLGVYVCYNRLELLFEFTWFGTNDVNVCG